MKRIPAVFLGLVIITTLGFAGCEKKDKLSITNNEKMKNIVVQKGNEKDNVINLELYFDSSTSKDKAEIAKEERIINREELVGEIIMQELLKGPANVSNLKPIFPKETKLISFSIKEGVAYINLSGEARVTMSPAKEEAVLRSILNSMTQLTSVSKIKLMIDSSDAKTLGGNFDVSKPFGKDDLQNILKK